MKGLGRWVLAVVATIALIVGAIHLLRSGSLLADGSDLFEGRKPLAGKLVGHSESLPAQALRCANCHSRGQGAPADTGYGPALSARHLTQALARRGGPPSTYDEAGFCRLLRTGIDPAWIQLPAGMPRYELSDAQCAALWSFVNRGSA